MSIHIADIDTTEVDVSQLVPELDDVNGVFQLGPPDRCKDVFVLSITVAFATDLADVSLVYFILILCS